MIQNSKSKRIHTVTKLNVPQPFVCSPTQPFSDTALSRVTACVAFPSAGPGSIPLGQKWIDSGEDCSCPELGS